MKLSKRRLAPRWHSDEVTSVVFGEIASALGSCRAVRRRHAISTHPDWEEPEVVVRSGRCHAFSPSLSLPGGGLVALPAADGEWDSLSGNLSSSLTRRGTGSVRGDVFQLK
eukprot:CAMPEP_0181331040 /NCGR_PEP_ID=MMETSP1101-20121128/24266_1 /TAXON_ID=46948 /ORGANISM="Rhodomonas abbreviata, Strain Caron Lab Isolate" /LENGTH=110 /DNA_ID=CAMNT_0023440427 /DNA_START=314 /DNA_END=647 /DNA_ORIENTATION=-